MDYVQLTLLLKQLDINLFIQSQFPPLFWAWTGVGTGRVCFCSEAGLNTGAREIGGTINRGKFLLAFF